MKKNKNLYVGPSVIYILFLLSYTIGGYGVFSFVYALIDLLYVTFVLMIIPYLLHKSNGKDFEYEKGKKICLYNSLGVWFVSFILSIVTDFGSLGWLAPFIYYDINLSLFCLPKPGGFAPPVTQPGQEKLQEEVITAEAESETKLNFCTNCGKELNDDRIYCRHCGIKLK